VAHVDVGADAHVDAGADVDGAAATVVVLVTVSVTGGAMTVCVMVLGGGGSIVCSGVVCSIGAATVTLTVTGVACGSGEEK
jgi:hypothetical protein